MRVRAEKPVPREARADGKRKKDPERSLRAALRRGFVKAQWDSLWIYPVARGDSVFSTLIAFKGCGELGVVTRYCSRLIFGRAGAVSREPREAQQPQKMLRW